MDKMLRILILEDSATDASLIEFELQEEQIPFVSDKVVNKEEFVRAIQECSYDLILSDYDLPQYNGSLALAEVKSRCPGTPFILVTGAVDERLAKEIIVRGASDCVMKGQLHQLGPAVQKVLGITSR